MGVLCFLSSLHVYGCVIEVFISVRVVSSKHLVLECPLELVHASSTFRGLVAFGQATKQANELQRVSCFIIKVATQTYKCRVESGP